MTNADVNTRRPSMIWDVFMNYPHLNPIDAAGFIPMWIKDDPEVSAVDQINDHYAHGGGWQDFDGFEVTGDEEAGFVLTYPDDPPMYEVVRGTLDKETVSIFPHAWVMVRNRWTGEARIARID